MKPAAFASRLLLPVLVLAGAAFASTGFAATPEETISLRQANQKRVGELNTSIKKALASGATAASQLGAVKEIDDRARLIKGYFPAGTETGGNTKARPDIWTNRVGFDAAADAYVAAFDRLVVLAQAGDDAGFTAQFATAGATCGACHRVFRSR